MRKLALSSDIYTHNINVHCKTRNFDVGDYVMVRISPKHYPKTVGPFPTLESHGSNAYLLDLPGDMTISQSGKSNTI